MPGVRIEYIVISIINEDDSEIKFKDNAMTNEYTGQNRSSEKHNRQIRNIVEFISALLMSLATIASGWCGYSATRWHSEQSFLMAETNNLRVQASRKLTRAGQEALIDITVFEEFYQALIEGRKEYVQRTIKRFRPETKIAIDAWLATKPLQNSNAPLGPFRMKEYQFRLEEEAQELNQQADKKFSLAREASKNADDYTLITAMLTLVLFFAGLTPHFTSFLVQRGILVLGTLQFLAALIILMKLPIG
jgi:hypothetical protein